MSDLKHRRAQRKRDNPNNRRIRELSMLARDQHPDGHGDYVLSDTPAGNHLAIALITHLDRAGQRNGRWLFVFCRDRAPFLDPDEIDVAALRSLRAQALGIGLQLTAAIRAKLGITSIAPCDQTPEQRAAARRAKRRERDRKRRQRKRKATRAEWLAANTVSKDKPWEKAGMSRAKYYREQARAKRETGGARSYLSLQVGDQPVSHGEPDRSMAVHAASALDGLTPQSSQRLRDSGGASLSVGGDRQWVPADFGGDGDPMGRALIWCAAVAAKPGDPIGRGVTVRARVTISATMPAKAA
jgi:hypothetical protein